MEYKSLVVSLILFTTFGVFFLYNRQYDINKLYNNFDYSNLSSDGFNEIKRDLRNAKLCVLNELLSAKSPIWPNLHNVINNCSFINRASKRSLIPFKTDKMFMPFTKSASERHCNVVSLGIGGEVTMEKQLKQIYPDCTFHGADPFPAAARAYDIIGKTYITAVDNKDGEMVLSTFNGTKYGWNKVPITSFGSFLSKTLNIDKVHFLSMDAEGSEYRLMPYMASTGAFGIESNFATICQISGELHGPLNFYNYTDAMFEKIFVNFLSASPFAPIKAYTPGNHHRIFFVNAEDDYCLNLFY